MGSGHQSSILGPEPIMGTEKDRGGTATGSWPGSSSSSETRLGEKKAGDALVLRFEAPLLVQSLLNGGHHRSSPLLRGELSFRASSQFESGPHCPVPLDQLGCGGKNGCVQLA